ncbi:MAG: Asp-tRNA(Asn)/Glu-tRNA(Gln) amidotransferase subunit GatB [archaeon]
MMDEIKVIIGLEIHAYLGTKSKLFCSCATGAGPKPWVKEYLEGEGVKFEFVEHAAVTRPIDSARVRGVNVNQIAKALVYVADDKPILFILSGDRKLDEAKAIVALNGESLRIATKDEVKEFTNCLVGLVPPVIKGIKKIIDNKLLSNDILSFNAGAPTAGIKIQKDILLSIIDNYSIANISEDELIVEEPREIKSVISDSTAEPNTLCCPVCLGHPGSKPVLNEKAVELGVKVGLAMNCNINEEFFFSRKTYFYPDMASNYQITQYEVPLAQSGFIVMPGGKKVRIRRAHLEWDPAALVHPDGMGKSSYVLIDYNRSGLPLIEIVTEPDLSSPAEAREFLNTLENILNYLNVLKSDTTLKVDCNVSINGGERVEIKNVSGFAAAERALSFEILRQKQEEKMGRKILQHTRAFNAESGITIELRKKETEDDYGYIFDPDLVKVSLAKEYLESIKSKMPELPEKKVARLISKFGLAEYDSRVLCSNFELGKLFDEMTILGANPIVSAKLLTREILAVVNHDSLVLSDVKLFPSDLFELVKLIDTGCVSGKNTKGAVINYISGDKSNPSEYLKKNNLLISETIDLNAVVNKVILANEKAVSDYKSGNQKTFNFLAGLVMRETKGTVSPQKVQDTLRQKLS